MSGLAIGAFNPLAASLLATYKNAAAKLGVQSAAATSSSSVTPTGAAAATPDTVPAADASAAARDSGASSAVQDFLSYANESPGQKLINSILKSMGLTKDDLKTMSPDKLKAVEQTIQQKIKEAAEEAAQKGKTGVIADVTA